MSVYVVEYNTCNATTSTLEESVGGSRKPEARVVTLEVADAVEANANAVQPILTIFTFEFQSEGFERN